MPNGYGDTPTKRLLAAFAASFLAAALMIGLLPTFAQAETGEGAPSETQGGADMGTPPDGQGGSDPGSPPDGEGGPGIGAPPDGGAGGAGGDAGGPGGGPDTQSFDYSGSYNGALSADGTDASAGSETVTATEPDHNAALAKDGGTLTLDGTTLEKSGDDTDGDRCNFYGVNSALLAVGSGSKAVVSGTKVDASSQGSNGIFSTDSATVYAKDSEVKTTASNSRGLDATYGGTIVADKLDMATQGDHCATIATDRGGGSISVTNSTLSTAGSGSPLLYSTGAIEVSKVEGSAAGSQLVGMEGYNTVRIFDSHLGSTVTGKTASDPLANGIIIYQSTSGDAETSTGKTAVFEASGSTLGSDIESGALFYITNTVAEVVLSGTALDFDAGKANLLTVAGNDANNWGKAGSNGGTVTFTGLGEDLRGNIDVDAISSLDLYLLDGTTYTGATAITENTAGTASENPLSVSIDDGSKWVVTGDSTVDDLSLASGALIVDEQGREVSIVVGGQEVVSGTSEYTLTVNDAYANTVITSDANAISKASVDRSGFDSQFGTSTAFGTEGVGSGTASGGTGDGSAAQGGSGGGFDFFAWLSDWWNALFGN